MKSLSTLFIKQLLAVQLSWLHSHSCVQMAFHSEGFPPHSWDQILLPMPLRVLQASSSPILLQPGQEPRLNTCLAKETAGESVICCWSRAIMLVCEPSTGSCCLPFCPSYIFILSSRACRSGKQSFLLPGIRAWEHGRMAFVNIQKIMVSFNFQQKAYLSLRRLLQMFPCRAEQRSRCKTMTGNFIYTKGNCKLLVWSHGLHSRDSKSDGSALHPLEICPLQPFGVVMLKWTGNRKLRRAVLSISASVSGHSRGAWPAQEPSLSSQLHPWLNRAPQDQGVMAPLSELLWALQLTLCGKRKSRSKRKPKFNRIE